VSFGDDHEFVDYTSDQNTETGELEKFGMIRAFKENAGGVERDRTRLAMLAGQVHHLQ
jgi:hypothetical protein